jgi:uroporphyrinogen-III synthase
MRLGITRSAEQLRDLAITAAARGITIVPVPVIETRPLAFSWPQELAATPDWVVVSSAAGVRSFAEGCQTLGRTDYLNFKYAAIGDKTAEALRDLNISPLVVASRAYGEALFEELVARHVLPGQSLLYARGAEINYDPADLLASRRIWYYPVICYETISLKVDQQVVDSFSPHDYVLFTAPSAVRTFHRQFGVPKVRTIAMGTTTGREMAQFGWPDPLLLAQPDISTVLEQIACV